MINKDEVVKYLYTIHDDNLLLGLCELGMVEDIAITGNEVEILLYDRNGNDSERSFEKYIIKDLLSYHLDLPEDKVVVSYSDISYKQDLDSETSDRIEVLKALKNVIDPELNSDIYDLGLIYGVNVDGESAKITMTLTSPQCPVAEVLPEMAQEEVLALQKYKEVSVDVVWEPMWTIDSMPYKTRVELGLN